MKSYYKIIRKTKIVDLEKRVNKFMKKGWQLHGNILVEEEQLHQCIIKSRKRK